MLFLSLVPKSEQYLYKQINQPVDGFEIRWDYPTTISPEWIRNLTTKPLIFTIRTKCQGGHAETVTWPMLERLLQAQPDYIDLEYNWPLAWFKKIKTNYPGIKIINSLHDWSGPPKKLPKFKIADIIKVAAYCHNALDGLKILAMRINKPFILIGMGPYAQFTRIMAKALGSKIAYVSCGDNSTAPGQLTLAEMLTYRYYEINSETKFYALIGNPVEHSIGHHFHNNYFKTHSINACYLKIIIDNKDLSAWLKAAKQFSFQGFSITMPLKKTTYHQLGSQDNSPSVNTLTRVANTWQGFNTDAAGAWNALLVKPKTALIFGAGGAGEAIANYLTNKGVHVRIYNRSHKINTITFDSVTQFPTADLIINTLPTISAHILDKIHRPFNYKYLDIVYNKSAFTNWAHKKNLEIITGLEMFHQQAILQQQLWSSVSIKSI